MKSNWNFKLFKGQILHLMYEPEGQRKAILTIEFHDIIMKTEIHHILLWRLCQEMLTINVMPKQPKKIIYLLKINSSRT